MGYYYTHETITTIHNVIKLLHLQQLVWMWMRQLWRMDLTNALHSITGN